MKLADEIRLLIRKIEAGGVYSEDAVIERASVLEAAYTDLQAAMTRANIPVAEPVCSITLTESGWYEWILPKRKCEYGYTTWREAHQAARAELKTMEVYRLMGKITGAVLYLKALAQALGLGNIVAEKLKKVIKLLEEHD